MSCVPFSSVAGKGAQRLVREGSRAAFSLQTSAVKRAGLFVPLLPSPRGGRLSVVWAGCAEQVRLRSSLRLRPLKWQL